MFLLMLQIDYLFVVFVIIKVDICRINVGIYMIDNLRRYSVSAVGLVLIRFRRFLFNIEIFSSNVTTTFIIN